MIRRAVATFPTTFRGMSYRRQSHPTFSRHFAKFLETPLPADAVTIPADARGAFHLPLN